MKHMLLWATGLAILMGIPAQAQAQSAGTKVAVIDINFIFKNHQRFKQTMEDIKQIEGVLSLRHLPSRS